MTFLKKILLIDPEPHAMAIVRSTLESTGQYLIKEEHDSRCAVTAARWFQPNLIMLELVGAMPDASSTVWRLQQERSLHDIPFVFVRPSRADADCVISGGILSGYSFFTTPVGSKEFVRWIAELLAPARD